MRCPKCSGLSHDLMPLKHGHEIVKVFGCPTCGFCFRETGQAVVLDTEKLLQDTFRGASLSEVMFKQTKEGLPPAGRAMFEAKLMEYGLQMWFDGLKQGLLLGAINATKNKVPSGE